MGCTRHRALPHKRRARPTILPAAPPDVCAANWLNLLATGLPSAVAFFINYIIIHAFATNVFRFFW